jgi:sulfite reductase (NADPH) flavoprotein alpha-component
MDPIHILFGTESNNAADLADRAGSALQKAGFAAQVIDMGDFASDKLPQLRTLLVITSTYGNGDPPSNAEALHAFLMKKCPELPAIRFAVLALGDKTYDRFCQCGKDFDRRLGELGAQRLLDRLDCDVDYEKPFKAWVPRVIEALGALAHDGSAEPRAPVVAVVEPQVAKPGTRRSPVSATVTRLRRLSGEASTKETLHVELSLAGTGLRYQPGDSLGVWPTNDPVLVDEVLKAASCDADAEVALRGVVHESSRGAGTMTLREALSTHVELAHVDARLLEAVGHPAQGAADGAGRHVLDVLLEAKRPIDAQLLVESLRPMAPRPYSLASSLLAHPDEAHLTVDVVRYDLRGRRRHGVASSLFADRAPVGASVPVYLHEAVHFRLPEDDVPIVMIGPGTGIAPFRAFLEERAARGAKGRSWLFFGARNAATDFLYGDELTAFRDRGVLTRLDCAFSRDQARRVYVQDRMREHARELHGWIADGAVVYVCGDAKRMAPDVHQALADVLAEAGGMSRDAAQGRLQAMADRGAYRRDVY